MRKDKTSNVLDWEYVETIYRIVQVKLNRGHVTLVNYSPIHQYDK